MFFLAKLDGKGERYTNALTTIYKITVSKNPAVIVPGIESSGFMVTSLMVADARIVNLYGCFVREGMKHEVSGTDWRCPSRSGDTLTYLHGQPQGEILFLT